MGTTGKDLGWIGVDLDGTLARYDGWQGEDHIGEPIQPMVDRVKAWLAEGREVRIFTARASSYGRSLQRKLTNISLISSWCEKYIGQVLPVTAEKDFNMVDLWDDRAHQVEFNVGTDIRDDYDKAVDFIRHLGWSWGSTEGAVKAFDDKE